MLWSFVIIMLVKKDKILNIEIVKYKFVYIICFKEILNIGVIDKLKIVCWLLEF